MGKVLVALDDRDPRRLVELDEFLRDGEPDVRPADDDDVLVEGVHVRCCSRHSACAGEESRAAGRGGADVGRRARDEEGRRQGDDECRDEQEGAPRAQGHARAAACEERAGGARRRPARIRRTRSRRGRPVGGSSARADGEPTARSPQLARRSRHARYLGASSTAKGGREGTTSCKAWYDIGSAEGERGLYTEGETRGGSGEVEALRTGSRTRISSRRSTSGEERERERERGGRTSGGMGSSGAGTLDCVCSDASHSALASRSLFTNDCLSWAFSCSRRMPLMRHLSRSATMRSNSAWRLSRLFCAAMRLRSLRRAAFSAGVQLSGTGRL